MAAEDAIVERDERVARTSHEYESEEEHQLMTDSKPGTRFYPDGCGGDRVYAPSELLEMLLRIGDGHLDSTVGRGRFVGVI